MELLLRRWERANEGEGQIVLISGEPGIGKSRITAALQERLTGEPHIRLRYFCAPHHRGSALHPFTAQLEHAAGFARDDTAGARFEKLATLLSKSGDTPPETLAALADLLALPTEQPLPADPRQKRELILDALIVQLEGLARRQPVLLVFEDAQWIDQTSLELLERAADRVPHLPVLMVITFRPEFASLWTGQAQVTALTLSRLGQRDTTTFVERLTHGKQLPAEIIERIVERTDGIPLFIEELTKSLLEGGMLREEGGRYVRSGPLRELAIPSSLHDSLMSRLDRLAPVKEVAQIGATIGREFSYELLAAVANRGENQLRDALDQLVGAGLIFRRGVQPGGSFIFKHALVQDAAYGTLLRRRRQELHAHIATALGQRFAIDQGQKASAGEHAALLAHHWSRAEEWEKALSYTLEAAAQARKLYALPEAISHYWQALDLLERLPPNFEGRQIRVDIVLSLLPLPGWMRDEAGRERILRHVDQALADAAAAGDLATLARLQAIKGQQWADEALLTSAVAYAQDSGNALAQSFAAFRYGQYLGIRCQFGRSLDHIARTIDILGTQGEKVQQAQMMAGAGRCFYARAGRLDQALRYATWARGVADANLDARLRAWCAAEAEPYMYKGLWNEVVRVAEERLPIIWEIRDWTLILFVSAWLAVAYLKLGRTADARRVLDRMFREVPARTLGFEIYAAAYRQIVLAQLHLAEGNPGEALSAVREAVSTSQRAGAPLEEGAAHRVLGQVYEAMGAGADAHNAFRDSLEVLEKIQCPPELAQTLLAYGRFRRGDNALEDRAMIERALALFEEMNAPGWIEEARAALASP